MRNVRMTLWVMVITLSVANIASAEIVRGIDIDFVTIGNAGNSGDTRAAANPTGCGAVGYEYQIGKYEVTNGQWDAFVSAAGAPTGNPSVAYNESATWTGTNVPTSAVSWYEAAQFCNYLTSGDKYSGAYNFDQNGNFLGIDRDWAVSAYDGIAYVIPTLDEWYKAAYYARHNSYSTYANGQGTIPVAGNGWNYGGGEYSSPWDVGTGTMEQNGTFDMMGNVWEWNETLSRSGSSSRGTCGGSHYDGSYYLRSSTRVVTGPHMETPLYGGLGFRVASISEPVMPINLDIKPQSCPNPFNVKSKGVLPVAILGTEEFDVSTIVPTSVRLAGVEPIRDSLEDVAAPLVDPNECECSTNGPDGFTDLTLKFETQAVLAALGEVNTGDIVTLRLTGVLNDETSIEGADCVVIVGRFKPINKADINKDGLVNTVDLAIVVENWLNSSIVEE